MANINRIFVASLVLILVSLLVAFIVLPYLPEEIPVHWDIHGNPNRYAPRAFALFFLPGLSLFLFLFLWWLPDIDPLKRNINEFRQYYEWFILSFVIFLLFVYALTLMEAFGFSVIKLIIVAIAFLLFGVAVLISHSKRSWFIGIRTPWTMSSDRVWEKTNSLGSRLFKVMAVAFLIAFFLPAIVFLILLIFIVAVSVFLVFYSYWLFRH